MPPSYICPDSDICSMRHVCNNFITLEVHNKYVMWQKEFAVAMIKQYNDHKIPFQIYRNCAHPDWQNIKTCKV